MKIKKIALVETKAVKTHVFSRVYMPRLGIPLLGSVLARAGYEVEFFFQELKPLDIDYLTKFDLVGISSLTPTVTEAYRLGKILKDQGQTVVMGGPHVSAMARGSGILRLRSPGRRRGYIPQASGNLERRRR